MGMAPAAAQDAAKDTDPRRLCRRSCRCGSRAAMPPLASARAAQREASPTKRGRRHLWHERRRESAARALHWPQHAHAFDPSL